MIRKKFPLHDAPQRVCVTIWEDDWNKFGRAIGEDWRMLAQDRGSWDAEEDRYVVFTG